VTGADADGGRVTEAATAPEGADDADVADRSPVALLVVLASALVPWSVQTFARPGAGLSLVFPWGLFNTAPPQVTTIYDFLFVYTVGLPEYILAWPFSVLLWAIAVVSAAVGYATGREDERVTALALVLAGVAQLSLATGFNVQPYRTAYPLGTLFLWAVAWWFYWPAVRASVVPGRS
jgi:uncharacterized protein (TIGR04206 family)